MLTGIYEDLGRLPEAKDILRRVTPLMPAPKALGEMPADLLEPYVWFLFTRDEMKSWSAANEWRKAIRQTIVKAVDRLTELRPKDADTLYLREFAYGRWAETLSNLGRDSEAVTAMNVAVDTARSLHDRAPQNAEYLRAYAEMLKFQASQLEDRDKLDDARRVVDRAYRLLVPAMSISRGSAWLTLTGSKVLEEYSSILMKQQDSHAALARKLEAIDLIYGRLRSDPENRSAVEDAINRFSNLSWIFSKAGTHEQEREQCLSLARQTLDLASAHPGMSEYSRLIALSFGCAVSAEGDLIKAAEAAKSDKAAEAAKSVTAAKSVEPAEAAKSAKSAEAVKPDQKISHPVDDLILQHVPFLVSVFEDSQLDPAVDPEFYEKMASVILRAQRAAEDHHDIAMSEHYARVIINVLGRLRPSLDYDIHTMSYVSGAFLDIGNDERKLGHFAEAARNYRICADPAKVAYPDVACMRRLIDMINAGELGPGHEQEVASLQQRIPNYTATSLTVSLSLSSKAPLVPYKVYVVTPPPGYAGVDYEEKWLQRARGLHLSKMLLEDMRRLYTKAQATHQPFPRLVLDAYRTPHSPTNDEAALDDMAVAFHAGNVTAALDQAASIYAKVPTKDPETAAKRKARIVERLRELIAAAITIDDAAAASAALLRVRAFVTPDLGEGAAPNLRRAYARLLDFAGLTAIIQHHYGQGRQLLAQADVIRRDGLEDNLADQDAVSLIARNLELEAMVAESEAHFTEARLLARKSAAIYFSLIGSGPNATTWRRHLASALALAASIDTRLGDTASALSQFQEAAKVGHAVYSRSSKSPKEAEDYLDLLGKLRRTADHAQNYPIALHATRKMTTLLRGLVQTDPKQADRLRISLSLISWYALFTRDWALAKQAGDEAFSMDQKDLVPEMNAAHARMFLGETQAARSIYLKYLGRTVQGRLWENAVRDDFHQLRQAHLDNPLMDTIEAQLGTRPPT